MEVFHIAKKEKALMIQLIEERGIKDVAGRHALAKELTAGTIRKNLDTELEDDLGYSKYTEKKTQVTK